VCEQLVRGVTQQLNSMDSNPRHPIAIATRTFKPLLHQTTELPVSLEYSCTEQSTRMIKHYIGTALTDGVTDRQKPSFWLAVNILAEGRQRANVPYTNAALTIFVIDHEAALACCKEWAKRRHRPRGKTTTALTTWSNVQRPP